MVHTRGDEWQGSIPQLDLWESASKFFCTQKPQHIVRSGYKIFINVLLVSCCDCLPLYSHLQDNKFTGTLDVLAALPLKDL
jgi:hypothetical protein